VLGLPPITRRRDAASHHERASGWRFPRLPASAQKYNDIHYYPGPQINDQVYRKLRMIGQPEDGQRAAGIRGRLPGRNVVPGLPVYVSELGYGSLPNLPAINERFIEERNPIVPPALYHRRLARQREHALGRAASTASTRNSNASVSTSSGSTAGRTNG